MCVQYVRFEFKCTTQNLGSGVNRVQIVLSGFSVRLLCFVQAKTLCHMVVCISCLHSYLCL